MASKKDAKHFTYNPYHQPNPDQIISLTSGNGNEEDKQKKPIVRRTVDYHTTIINYLETRAYHRTFRNFKKIYPTSNAIRHMRPIPFEISNEAHGFCTKYVSTSINKHKCAINCLIVKLIFITILALISFLSFYFIVVTRR